MINTKGAGHIHLRLATSKARKGLLALMRIELRWPTKPHAALLCPLAALTGASSDQVAFKLSQAAKNREHSAPVWGCSIGPCIDQGPEANLALTKRMQDVEQVSR
jgi:hypothetical protein